jgi:hypothetical protein
MSSRKAENDELKLIKSQLDHSLDLNKILVSEELIQRTLEAVKKAKTEKQADENGVLTEQKSQFTKSSSGKTIQWNKIVRQVAGVAAAILIVAGFGMLSQMHLGMGKKSANMMDSSMAPQTTANDNNAKMDFNGGKNNLNQDYTANDSVTSSDSGSPEDSAAPESSLGDSNIEPEESAVKSNEENKNIVTSKFSEIFFGTPSEIKSLRITNESTDKEIVLTSRKSIDGFYTMMQQYTFKNSSVAPVKQLYLIEAKGSEPEGDQYDMVIGETISITHKEKNSTGYGEFAVDNPKLMLQNIADFYQNNAK